MQLSADRPHSEAQSTEARDVTDVSSALDLEKGDTKSSQSTTRMKFYFSR